MLAPTFQGLDGRRDAIVHMPPYSLAGRQGKATMHIAADEADPPPLIAGTVHDYSSRRGVLNCNQSLVHRKLRAPPLPNSASFQPPWL
jgi:hypothetical protein